MTVDFFVKAYDFKDFKINKAILKNGLLKIYVTINAHLDLIANGYRPELDVDYDTKFILSVDKDEDIISNLDSFNCYLDKDYYVEIGDKKYKLISRDIVIEN